MNQNEKVFIDWCRFTFLVRSDQEAIQEATDFILSCFDGDLVPAQCAPQHGYSGGLQFVYGSGDHAVRCVSLFYGGSHTGDTACIDINGHGCKLVIDWELVKAFVESVSAKLTRVDTALDFPNGEFTMRQAVAAYKRDEFNLQRKPVCNCMGDWIDHQGRGRSLMVGRRENGKQGRVYEKGKQLGNPESPWVRFEVEWLSKDRVLPYDIVTRPEGYFTGAYPVCKRLLKVGAERIRTLRLEWLYGIEVGRRNLRTQYGPMLYQLRDTYTSEAEMVADLMRPGCPRRLEVGAIVRGSAPALSPENVDG
jgi:phage replication initiation protein